MDKVELLYANAKNHNDLLDLNIKFLHGSLNKTIYHFGSIDSETIPILSLLVSINEKKLLTVESQPYINEKTLKQKPYLKLFSSLTNVQLLMKLEDKGYFIRVYDRYNKSIKYISSLFNFPFTITKINEKVHTAISVYVDDEFKDYNAEQFIVEIVYPTYDDMNLFNDILDIMEK